MSKSDELKKVEDDVLALTDGDLVTFRRENNYYPVVGEGDCDAKILFVGEAPGENEAKTGKPFVGRAGKFLNELLESADIEREKVYITSIVKDRPPKNRDPLPKEIAAYAPYLDRQIEIIKPRVIATLGRFAMNYVMNRYGLSSEIKPISEIHGRVFDTSVAGETVRVIVLFHPAAAIYNQKLKGALFEDFQALKTLTA